MDKISRNSFDLGLLLLRLSFGFLMLTHGWPKLMRLMGPDVKFADPIGLGAIFGAELGQYLSLLLAVGAEFGCSLLLIVGALTRLATIPLIITMAVAAFIIHGADPLAKKESALHFLFVYLTLLGTGAGRFSVDQLIFKKSSSNSDD